MKRWHEESPRTYREWRKHYLSHVDSNIRRARISQDPYNVDCVCDQQKGRFRKKKAFDCGITQCFICHAIKFPKREVTYQELCADLRLKEGIEEIGSAGHR